MTPQLWSLNGLATETGIDRRTLGRYLASVKAAGQGAHGPLYRLRDLIEELRERRFVSVTRDSALGFHRFGRQLRRDLKNGFADQLARTTDPAAISRAVLERFAGGYFRALRDVRGSREPDPPDWSQATERNFSRAIAALLSSYCPLPDVVSILETGKERPHP